MPHLSHQFYRLYFTGCWLVLCLIWAAAALRAKRIERKWSPGEGIGYMTLLALGIYLLVGDHGDRGRLLHAGHRTTFAGAIVCGLGLLFTLWARLTLARNWSGSVALKADHELVERGPYRRVRHPIYTGMTAMLFGCWLGIGSCTGAVGVALFVAIHVWKLRFEERLMTERFPQAYPEYMKRTWALVPGLF